MTPSIQEFEHKLPRWWLLQTRHGRSLREMQKTKEGRKEYEARMKSIQDSDPSFDRHSGVDPPSLNFKNYSCWISTITFFNRVPSFRVVHPSTTISSKVQSGRLIIHQNSRRNFVSKNLMFLERRKRYARRKYSDL